MFTSSLGVDNTVVNTVITIVDTVNLIADANNAFFAPPLPNSTRLPKRPRNTVI
jgi:hypothetical protein